MKRFAFPVLFLIACGGIAYAQSSGGRNAAAIIAQYESSGNPTARSNKSTASGLYGFLDGTWATYAQQAGVSLQQYPHAYMAPASVQTAVFYQDFNSHGFSDWTCPGCDPKATAAIQAAGGTSAFAQGSTDPASYAALDTSSGLQQYFASGGASDGAGTPDLSVTDVTPQQPGGIGSGTAVGTTPATVNGGGGLLDNVTQSFQTAAQGWQSALYPAALDLFGILAGIELFVMIFMLVCQGERPVWSDVVFVLVRFFIVVGLFLWLLQNGPTFMTDIVQSLRQAGQAAGSPAITPSAIFAAGVNIALQVASPWALLVSPATYPLLGLAAIVIVLLFAMTACWVVLALIESYFVIGASALLLAFGALRFSRDIAISLIRYTVAAGFKLLAIELIVGVMTQLINGMILGTGPLAQQSTLTLVGASAALFVIAKWVPDLLARIVTGSPMPLASHHSVGFGAVAAPIVVGAGAGVAIAAAVKAAMAEVGSAAAAGTVPNSSAARAGMMLGSTARNLASAGGQAAMQTLGMISGRGLTGMTWRAAALLHNQNRLNSANANRPAQNPPPPPQGQTP